MFAAICVLIAFLNTIVLGSDFIIVSINLLVEIDIKIGSNTVFALSSSITPSPAKSKVRLSSILRIGGPDILIETYTLYSSFKNNKTDILHTFYIAL